MTDPHLNADLNRPQGRDEAHLHKRDRVGVGAAILPAQMLSMQ